MDKIINTINRADNALDRLKSGCMWVFLNLVWIILLGAAVYVGKSSWELKQQGASATGSVVSLREVPETDNSGVTYAPVINYDVNGRTYTYESSNSSDPPAYDVGEKVQLLYRPNDPEDVRVNSWFDLWFLPAMLGGGGVVVAIVSIVMMVGGIRRRRQMRTA
jgi:hypothetical protein